jgi:hypothetical protein
MVEFPLKIVSRGFDEDVDRQKPTERFDDSADRVSLNINCLRLVFRLQQEGNEN